MNKTIILLSILFSQFVLKGQYKPMLEPGKVWTQHFGYHTAGGFSDSISMSGADSLINGTTYYKLDGVLLPGNWPSSDPIGNPILAREDTINGKVWIFVDSLEYLWYDYSVMAGDTVTVFANNRETSTLCDSLQSYIVNQVDTFIDLEGTPRKEIHLQHITQGVHWACINYMPIVWIEGLGSERGINMVALEGILAYSLCVWKSGTQLYQGAGWGDTCWVGSTIGVESFEKASYDIFPNPAVDDVFIRSKSHPIQSVKLYDLRGNVLLHQQNNDKDEEVTLSISGFASGMYVMRIESTSGGISTTKLQIQ